MKLVELVGSLSLLLPSVQGFLYPYTGHATFGGRVGKYTGSLCEEYGLDEVYVFAESSIESQEALVELPLSLLAGPGAVVGDGLCQNLWRKFYCFSAFPPPFTQTHVAPRQICQKSCIKLLQVCQSGFEAVAEAGYGTNLIQCEDEINDPSRSSSFMYPNFLNEWDRLPQFPESALTISDTYGFGPIDVPCVDLDGESLVARKTCSYPYIEVSRNLDGENHDICRNYTTSMVDSKTCVSACEVLCPTPVWEEGTFDMLWVFRWLPAILAIPLNLVVSVNEFRSLRSTDKKVKKNANMWVLQTALLGLAYAIVDSFPSLILKEQMSCGSEETYTRFEGVDNEFGHSSCAVFQYNVHILQMMYASVAVTLVQLYLRISNALQMKSHQQSKASIALSYAYIFGFPGALFLIHTQLARANGLTTYTDEATNERVLRDLADANALRYVHACGPRFETIGEEWAIVMGPFLVLGAPLLVLSVLLLKLTYQMVAGMESGSGSVNKTQVNIARTMVKFAICCSCLVLLNVVSLVPFINNALQFAWDMGQWQRCAITGVDVRTCTGSIADCPRETDIGNETKTTQRCGRFDDSAPAPTLLLLLNLTYSLPPAIFGFLFGFKLLRQKICSRVSQYVAPASS